MNADVRHGDLWNVLDRDAQLEQIATGFEFVEGPVWHPRDQHLTFSDIVGNTMYRWQEGPGVSIFRQPSNMANGNTYDRDGRLLTCEHATSRVTRTSLDGQPEVLASHYDGRELNSPNDIVVKRDGMIYFTDPTSGRSARWGVPREPDLPFRGVYRLHPQTKDLILLIDDFSKPNGLCFDLEERRLFVNDTDRKHIRVFDVQADGTLANGQLWAELQGDGAGVADGMKIDQAGTLFCCGPGGIHVFAPDATCLGVLHMPEHTANFAWGDRGLQSLYITASTSVYRLRLTHPGLPVF
jgi:gluconolactonase